MINLLPIENQKEIRRIYRSRLSNVVLLALSSLIIAGGIILIPSYVIFNARANEAKSRLGEFSEEDKRLTEEGLNKIAELRSKVNLVFPASQQKIFLTERLGSILDVRPSGLLISEINITDKKDFSIRGVAKARQDVISFVDNLESVPDIANINSPVSNLISEHDGAFIITFSFKN